MIMQTIFHVDQFDSRELPGLDDPGLPHKMANPCPPSERCHSYRFRFGKSIQRAFRDLCSKYGERALLLLPLFKKYGIE
jgi:hypothetical protein